jgi:hypothetical protein
MKYFNIFDPIIEPTMRIVRQSEKCLGPEDDWVEEDRRVLFEIAEYIFGNYHTFITEKSLDDYFTTALVDSDIVEVALDNSGYDRNLASKRAYRTHHSGGKQWAVGAYAKPIATDGELLRQHHIYLFEAPNGRTDIYGHTETSVVEGAEHLTEMGLIHGDPLGMTEDALHSAKISHTEREIT